MSKFIPLKYHDLDYPSGFSTVIGEITASFSVSRDSIKNEIINMRNSGVKFFSLHTQEPYSKDVKGYLTTENSQAIIAQEYNMNRRFPTIYRSPIKMWGGIRGDSRWTSEFIDFTKTYSAYIPEPEKFKKEVRIIELHPMKMGKNPEKSLSLMIERLKIYCNEIINFYPNAEFVVENSYSPVNESEDDNYLLNGVSGIREFAYRIKENKNIRLGIALDIPQLLKSEGKRNLGAEADDILEIFKGLREVRQYIRTVHLSGAKANTKDGFSHHGDLDTLFDHGKMNLTPDEKDKVQVLKKALLDGMWNLFSDNEIRYFVPELNRDTLAPKYLASIINDLNKKGFEFLKKDEVMKILSGGF